MKRREYATLSQRIYALGIDLFLLILPIYLAMLVVWSIIYIIAEGNFPEIYEEMQKAILSPPPYISPILIGVYYVQIIAVFLVIISYFTISEVKMKGQSVGKIIMNIKVITEGSKRYGYKTSLIRNFLRILDIPFGFLLILKSKKKQRAGDLFAKTVVIVDK